MAAANAVAWLASDEARDITGTVLPVDAGTPNRRDGSPVRSPAAARCFWKGDDVTNDDRPLWDMVCAAREGILATIGADGVPHLTNVNFLADADARVVRLTTTTDRAKGRNLLRDPRASLHAQGQDPYHFAVVAGPVRTAVAETVGDAAIDELHDLIEVLRGPAERPAFDEEMLGNRRMLVEISVERIYGLIPPPRRSR